MICLCVIKRVSKSKEKSLKSCNKNDATLLLQRVLWSFGLWKIHRGPVRKLSNSHKLISFLNVSYRLQDFPFRSVVSKVTIKGKLLYSMYVPTLDSLVKLFIMAIWWPFSWISDSKINLEAKTANTCVKMELELQFMCENWFSLTSKKG